MTELEIGTSVIEMLRQVLRVKVKMIQPEARIFSDLGAESLDVLDIRFRLEKLFGISITDDEIIASLGENLTNEEIDNAFTVQSIIDFTSRKMSAVMV
ncbi:MAG: phosphopantetheine-binding protein [bacterium]